MLLIAGTLLRIRCASGDLWLDEIWSLEFTRHVSSLAGILAWRHDNNHVLNSIYFFLCGPGRTSTVYRAMSLMGGAAFQVVFWRWPLWRCDRERLIGAVLAGSSYLLVLYSSEARGYSLMLVFEALAVWLARSWLHRPAEWKRLFFATSVVLGLLAHATFGLFYGALFLATVSRESVRLHRTALAASVVYGAAFISSVVLGGGNAEPWYRALAQFGVYASGFPQLPLTAVLVVGFSLLELVGSRRDDPRLFRLCAWGLTLPVIAAGVLRPTFMHPRYFLAM